MKLQWICTLFLPLLMMAAPAIRAADCQKLSEACVEGPQTRDIGGYPKGISGRDIPLPARIVAVAEAFDILTAAQHRNEADRIAAAIGNVLARKGTEFDPVCVEALSTQLDKAAEVMSMYTDPA